jgi:hypothetical protein
MPKNDRLASRFKIRHEPNKFDDHFLDVVGNAFKFDHPKGLAEWLKNAADAYATRGVPDAEQFILLRFGIQQPKNRSVFECIDFVGCTKKDIDDALKIWGSPTAAKKGTNAATFGGHGNGGKFYMRQMFERAAMITFSGGLLNVFGFDDKKYGFDPQNTNRRVSLEAALEFAEISGLDVPKAVRHRWHRQRSKAGFSVIRGTHPQKFSGRATVEGVLDGLRYHPQARRLLRHKQVLVLLDENDAWGARLEPPSLRPREGFEDAREIPLPKSFPFDGRSVSTRTDEQKKPRLILRTSEEPLSRSRELSPLNAIDILGTVGCIGSYRMNELGFLRHAGESEFIYGECECAFLEDPALDCVSNDREKLVSNDLTSTLLDWINKQIDQLSTEIADKRRSDKQSKDLAQSSLFNQILDKWKNKFMSKLSTELFGGSQAGVFGGVGLGQFGLDGSSANGEERGGGGGHSGTDESKDAGANGGSGDEKRRARKFPTVLLSGYDRDPFDAEASGPHECDERQPPVHQRPIDVMNNVYWINTSRPLARKVLDRYGAADPRWREYLFQRYVEIILKQQLYELQRKDTVSAESVDNLIDKVTSIVHDAASEDLEQFLFDESMPGMTSRTGDANDPNAPTDE